MKKRLFLIALFVVSSLFIDMVDSSAIVKKENSTKIYFGTGSQLKINCKTNVNSFHCEFDVKQLSDSLSITYDNKGSKLEFTKANFILPNIFFDCGGRGINKDFHALLKTEEFPEIKLSLINVNYTDNTFTKAMVRVDIMICDIIKTYNIPVKLNTDRGLMVSGKLPIDIIDFSLEPPKKVLGMIKVSNLIEIEFKLNILAC